LAEIIFGLFEWSRRSQYVQHASGPEGWFTPRSQAFLLAEQERG